MVGTVVGCWAEAWVVCGGGVQVSSWEELRLMDWFEESGILGEVEMGSAVEF